MKYIVLGQYLSILHGSLIVLLATLCEKILVPFLKVYDNIFQVWEPTVMMNIIEKIMEM